MVTEADEFWRGFAERNMEILTFLVVHNVIYPFREIFIGIEKQPHSIQHHYFRLKCELAMTIVI